MSSSPKTEMSDRLAVKAQIKVAGLGFQETLTVIYEPWIESVCSIAAMSGASG